MNAIVEDIQMQPIALGDVVADTPEALAELILAESDKQVEAKALVDADVRTEFALSCDALNYARVAWRCAFEWGTRGFDEAVGQRVRKLICARRGTSPTTSTPLGRRPRAGFVCPMVGRRSTSRSVWQKGADPATAARAGREEAADDHREHRLSSVADSGQGSDPAAD